MTRLEFIKLFEEQPERSSELFDLYITDKSLQLTENDIITLLKRYPLALKNIKENISRYQVSVSLIKLIEELSYEKAVVSDDLYEYLDECKKSEEQGFTDYDFKTNEFTLHKFDTDEFDVYSNEGDVEIIEYTVVPKRYYKDCKTNGVKCKLIGTDIEFTCNEDGYDITDNPNRQLYLKPKNV
jgi:hypothetical protein